MIRSARLDLVSLPAPVLDLLLAGDLRAAGRLLDLTVPPGWAETVPAAFRLEQLRRDPGELPWLVRAMVERHPARRIVGHIGFHAPPFGEGEVEVGYQVLPDARRRGLAREALRAITDWAHREHGVRFCRASVAPDNEASLALVRSVGFVPIGEQWDEEDGLELVFRRALPLPRAVPPRRAERP